MVDTNFKLTWYNHLFLEQLYLSDEEVRSDAFHWDYVRDYLNLNEDPLAFIRLRLSKMNSLLLSPTRCMSLQSVLTVKIV